MAGMRNGRTIRRLIVAAIVLLLVPVAFEAGRRVGLWGDTDNRRRLLADPMAARDLDGMTLVDDRATAPTVVLRLWPWQPDRVEHRFRADGDPVDRVARLGELATEHGWTREAAETVPGSWRGVKWTPHGPASLGIRAEGPESPDAGTITVSISGG